LKNYNLSNSYRLTRQSIYKRDPVASDHATRGNRAGHFWIQGRLDNGQSSGERGYSQRGWRHPGKARAVLYASVGLAGLLAGSSASSQSTVGTAADGSPTIDLETITVTGREDPKGPINGYVAKRSTAASKTDTPILKTPQAVTVIGREQIEDQKPNNLAEAVRYAPGIRGETYGSDARNDWFLIRGFPAQDVGLFLDGLQLFYTSYAAWKLNPFGLERIEVLRGPSSVLYGGSSPGGIVNAVSKRPLLDPLHYVELGINNFGNRYAGFDVSGSVDASAINGKLYYRLVGQVKNGGTQTDFTDDDRYYFAPSFTWKPDADTTLTVLGSVSYDHTNSQNFLPYIGTVVPAPFGRISTRLFASDPSVDTWDRNQALIGYEFEHRFANDVTFRQNARYGYVNVTFSDLFGLGYATTPAAADLARGNFLTTPTANQVSVDNQTEVKFATGPVSHTALLGLDFRRYTIDDTQGFGAAPSLNLVQPVYLFVPRFSGAPFQDSQISQNQLGLYLQDQIELDRWTLVLSGRHDWVATENENRLGPSQSRDVGNFSGRAGLIYNTDFGLAPYASYARSFNPIIGVNPTTGQLFAPEAGEQVEVGFKYQPAGFQGYIGAALFDLRRQNVLAADPTNPLLSTQSGEVRSRGFELEAVANLMPGLKLVGAFTAYDIEVTQDLDPAKIGKVPTNTPQRFGSLWLDYTIQTGVLQGLGFGGGIRAVGHSFADEANTLAVPSHVVADAAIHYDRANWRVAVNVSNLTDEIFVGSCSSPTACFYGDRRRVTASVGYRW
jgi:iron complex outermembrane receptor protein